MASALLSLAGWTFLPDLVTSNLQSFYYGLTIRAGDPRPQPGTPLFRKHWQRIHIAVILTYALYTIYEADWSIQRAGDFYRDLGVPHDVGDKALQSRFRKLTLLHHPDKVSDSNSLSEAYYVHLKLARETLSEPAKRFAYDRFGPDIVQWRGCVTIREYMLHGLRQSIVPFYVGSLLVLGGMDWLDLLGWGGFWRYLIMALLFAIELHTTTRPEFAFPTLAPTVFNPVLESVPAFLRGLLDLPLARERYLPFQATQFMHRAMVALFMAMARLGRLVFSRSFITSQFGGARASSSAEGAGPNLNYIPDTEEEIQTRLQRLEQLAGLATAESKRLLMLDAAPFAIVNSAQTTAAQTQGEVARQGLGASEELLRNKVKSWLVTNAIRNDPGVQQAVRTVAGRSHADRAASRETASHDPSGIDSSPASSAPAPTSE